jgi:hypothetical protein|uniref:Uncharacterized protein n=1 Tax=Mus musculus TaxID=10090 RepID=Q3URH4_MOUSE|nr:unnamed protein product [Mus musculus]
MAAGRLSIHIWHKKVLVYLLSDFSLFYILNFSVLSFWNKNKTKQNKKEHQQQQKTTTLR